MAEASLFVLDLPKDIYDANTEPMLSHINVGSGAEISIGDLARLMADATGYAGEIAFDPSKPDGTPRKLMDVRRLADMGWRARIDLRDGIGQTYDWYLSNADRLRSGV
jgi:nucleoside-diphosphate-sugar epimerase